MVIISTCAILFDFVPLSIHNFFVRIVDKRVRLNLLNLCMLRVYGVNNYCKEKYVFQKIFDETKLRNSFNIFKPQLRNFYCHNKG